MVSQIDDHPYAAGDVLYLGRVRRSMDARTGWELLAMVGKAFCVVRKTFLVHAFIS